MGHFKRDHLSTYAVHQNIDKDSFFLVVDRQHLLQQIVNSTRFSDEPNDVGLTKLLYDGVYQACYPLHEGKHRLVSGEFAFNKRQQLKRDWARFGRIFKYQPHDAIRGRWYMCPLCDRESSYWNLAPDTCIYAKITHYVDNDGTVGLSIIASIWASLFLEFWKRRQATLAQKWHTSDFLCHFRRPDAVRAEDIEKCQS